MGSTPSIGTDLKAKETARKVKYCQSASSPKQPRHLVPLPDSPSLLPRVDFHRFCLGHFCMVSCPRSRSGILMSRLAIKDEFKDLPISRQRKYQLRMQRDNRCTECGEPAVSGSRCLKHLIRARERQRKKLSLRRRYYNTLGYQLAGTKHPKVAKVG